MAKRKFFNTKDSHKANLDRARKRSYVNYHTKRAAILESLKPEIERISAISQLAESLSMLVVKKGE